MRITIYYLLAAALGLLLLIAAVDVYALTPAGREATAKRLFVQKNPCPCTKKSVVACAGYILVWKKELSAEGDVAPYNLMWKKLKPL
jgi:hypothetical protein